MEPEEPTLLVPIVPDAKQSNGKAGKMGEMEGNVAKKQTRERTGKRQTRMRRIITNRVRVVGPRQGS